MKTLKVLNLNSSSSSSSSSSLNSILSLVLILSASLINSAQAKTDYSYQPIWVKSKYHFKKKHKQIKRYTKKTQKNADLNYNMAQWAGIYNHVTASGQYLTKVSKNKKSMIQSDQILMTRARLAYQKKQYNKAIRFYSQVKQSSSFWFEALEEKSWAYVRQKKYGPALAQLKTLMIPLFSSRIGPEPYYLASYIHLRVCNFIGVFNTLKLFKKRISPRVTALEDLKNSKKPAAIVEILNKVDKGTKWKHLGKTFVKLPRFAIRDRKLMQSAHIRHQWAVKSQTRPGHYTRQMQRQAHIIRARIKYLAQQELHEISKNLTKLHLVETEATQHLHREKRIAADTNNFEDTDNSRELTFPGDDEIWLDELDKYQIKTQNCLPGGQS